MLVTCCLVTFIFLAFVQSCRKASQDIILSQRRIRFCFVFDKNRKRFAEFTLDGLTLLTVPDASTLLGVPEQSRRERSRTERSKRLSMTKVPFFQRPASIES